MSTSSLKRKKTLLSNENDDRCSLKKFGEGDSYYEESLFSPESAIEILKKLDEQIIYLPREQFQFKIFNTVNLLPRDKAFYGDIYADGSCEYLFIIFFFWEVCFSLPNRSTLSI
jgi:hypothetical protein